jgi:hypothetical protein
MDLIRTYGATLRPSALCCVVQGPDSRTKAATRPDERVSPFPTTSTLASYTTPFRRDDAGVTVTVTVTVIFMPYVCAT